MGLFKPLRTISCTKWQNNGIAVLLSEQWAGIVVRPGREGWDGTGRVNLCHGDETRKTGGPHPECFLL